MTDRLVTTLISKTENKSEDSEIDDDDADDDDDKLVINTSVLPSYIP